MEEIQEYINKHLTVDKSFTSSIENVITFSTDKETYQINFTRDKIHYLIKDKELIYRSEIEYSYEDNEMYLTTNCILPKNFDNSVEQFVDLIM